MSNNFSYQFSTNKTADEVFAVVRDVRKWWSGIFDETITGNSENVNDTFTFAAGGGAHESTQKLAAVVPNKKIVWDVTKSNLSFLKHPEEWKGTRFYFDVAKEGDKTNVRFTHEGLKPEIECYEACTGGWMQYLHKLEQKLQ